MKATKTILLIEDDISLCVLIEGLLARAYEVKAVTHSIAAWDWLHDGNHPDLIITDIVLPRISGLDLVQDIRSSSLYGNPSVIVLSGHFSPKIEKWCYTKNVQACLSKPFTPETLLDTVNAVIDGNTSQTINEYAR